MLLTRQEISWKNLLVLENSISFTKKVDRQYDDKFGQAGAKIGYIINIRKPARAVSTAGQGIQLQDYIERSVPLVLNKQYQQARGFTSSDMALSLDDFTNRVTKPLIVQIANDVDFDGLQRFVDVPAEVGTPGTVPTAADTYLNALQILADEGFPIDDEENLSLQSKADYLILKVLSLPIIFACYEEYHVIEVRKKLRECIDEHVKGLHLV